MCIIQTHRRLTVYKYVILYMTICLLMRDEGVKERGNKLRFNVFTQQRRRDEFHFSFSTQQPRKNLLISIILSGMWASV